MGWILDHVLRSFACAGYTRRDDAHDAQDDRLVLLPRNI